MEKLAYLLWNEASGKSGDAFRDELLSGLPRALSEEGASQLKVAVTDSGVAAGEMLHLGAHAPNALVTFWLECVQDRAPAEAILSASCERLAGYLVAESQPLRVDTPPGAKGAKQ